MSLSVAARRLLPGLAAATVVSPLLLLSACTAPGYLKDSADWQAIHRNAVPSPAGTLLARQGFKSCINLFEDAILHATEGHRAEAITGHSPGNIDLRPVTATLAFAAKGDIVHANVIAGVDRTGKCYADWRTSLVLRTSCRRAASEADWLREYSPIASPSPRTTAYGKDGGNITVMLTRVGFRRCLVTSGETAYWEGDGQDVPEVNHIPFID